MSQTPRSLDIFLQGIWKDNPVFVMVLGICPTLAVTNTAINALAMGLASTFVLICSGILVSLLRNIIPKQIRIASFIVIIATFVTIADYAIQAISVELYKALGAFIQLIVVNCIIMGRAEAFASRNRPWPSALDGLGMGLGFTLALLCLGGVREILGSGTFFGIQIFPDRFQPWSVFVLPPGGFFVLAGWLVLFAGIRQWRAAREAERAG